MNIVITNVYCYLNKGDAGIVISMVEQLRKIYEDSKIYVVSLYPEIDKGKYGNDVKVISAPIIPIQKGSKFTRIMHNLKYYIKENVSARTNCGTEFNKCIKNADIVVSCGGGYMQCRNLKSFFSDYILHYIQLEIAYIQKKKYIIFAQTVGPFSNVTKKIVYPIMKKSLGILTREEISYEYAKNNFSNPNIFLTADIAFLLNEIKYKNIIVSNKTKIGVTVRDWYFPNRNNREILKQHYFNAMVKFIDAVVVKYNADVYIMPQVIGPGLDNDLFISEEIKDRVQCKSNVFVLRNDLRPGEIKNIYAKMDYFIGTRMHSNIFALSENIPCLAISYDYKTDGIMRMVKMSEYIIDINDITFEKLFDKFSKLVEDQKCYERLNEEMINIKRKAYSNISLIQYLLEES